MPLRSDPAGWRDTRQRFGVAAEIAAMRFLRVRGWAILEHRFRMGRHEVDIVARKGSVVSFIEVKARGGTGFGSPLEAVTWVKQREIARVAHSWVDRHGVPGTAYRFDVIGVTVVRGAYQFVHVEDAFRA